MVMIPTDRQLPGLLHPQRFCRNGQIPMAPYVGRISRALQHTLAFRRKLVFQYHSPFVFTDTSGAAGSAVRWRCRFHTGYSAKRLFLRVLLAPSTQGTAPYVTWTITPDGGSPITTPALHGSLVDSANGDAPDTLIRRQAVIDISANTSYGGYLTAYDYVRPISGCIYEGGRLDLDDTEPAVVIVQPARRAPVLASHIDELWNAQLLTWQRNGSHLFSWSKDTSAVTLTTTTFTNIWDQTSTSVSTSSPGVSVDTVSHSTRSGSGVPVRFAVYAYVSTGTGAVRLANSSGALLTANLTTTQQWVEVSGTIPDAIDKLDVQAKADSGGAQVTVEAVSLYEYA